ncbi:MAG: electron transfer flavoprotein subunit beta/FixA family protein [Gordonia sp. (in: high G+C Gram-positive bacteria)]|uniref:electron transfer flavoprotein subunit beta/FixA family protein n=1 Tax=Gordonia sp. (in: high G+C Gram-positive bacteria) TaxID=84139 RepID=UPI003BB5F728
MTNVVVLIKHVPDYTAEWKLSDDDYTLDRGAVDGIIDEINERAVEQALQITEANGGEVTIMSAGPEKTADAIRKALSMGADKAIHIQDDAIHGSDAVQTAYLLATALGTVDGVELVIAGNESSDGRAGAVPAMIAEYLDLPHVTHLRKLEVSGDSLTGERETDDGIYTVEASLPAIVSVNEKINEPRFPSFKGIMAAKKKVPTVLTVAELGIEDGVVGGGNSGSSVTGVTPKPPRSAGERITDEGDGGVKVVEYLAGQKII